MEVPLQPHAVNWTRKLWHIVGGLVAITLSLLVPWPYNFFIAFGTLLSWVTIESVRRREPWFGRLFFTIASPFVRHFERRRIVGNTWFALAITIITALFRDPILIAASVVGWTFGDPAAEIVGKTIRSKKFFDGEKSLAGTLGCFVMSFAAYLVFLHLVGVGGAIASAALIGAAVTTIAELLSFSYAMNDNFLIPLASALAFSYVLG